MFGSPDCNIDRTFIFKFYFKTVTKKTPSPKKIYRNPIYLTREYKNMIDTGEVKNQAELAKVKGVSRARVTQILNLLNLNHLIIQELEKLGDPLETNINTERMLRPYVNKSPKEQKALSDILKILFQK